MLSVAVTTPMEGAAAQEITLPANTQAFIDTPIYARTSGYLRKWYADIGAHVHSGQLLAEIETPELDQQVRQAQSDLATAQSNQQIAQITAERWTKLLAKNAVSKQETDQAMSDFRGRQSALSAAEANVMRLQQLQGFEKIYAPFDGVITARNIDIGVIDPGGRQQPATGRAVPYGVHGQAAVYSYQCLRYMPTRCVTAATSPSPQMLFPMQKFTGTIVRNSDAIDLSSRTLNVEVDVVNSEHKLLAGAICVHPFAHPAIGFVHDIAVGRSAFPR